MAGHQRATRSSTRRIYADNLRLHIVPELGSMDLAKLSRRCCAAGRTRRQAECSWGRKRLSQSEITPSVAGHCTVYEGVNVGWSQHPPVRPNRGKAHVH